MLKNLIILACIALFSYSCSSTTGPGDTADDLLTNPEKAALSQLDDAVKTTNLAIVDADGNDIHANSELNVAVAAKRAHVTSGEKPSTYVRVYHVTGIHQSCYTTGPGGDTFCHITSGQYHSEYQNINP